MVKIETKLYNIVNFKIRSFKVLHFFFHFSINLSRHVLAFNILFICICVCVCVCVYVCVCACSPELPG